MPRCGKVRAVLIVQKYGGTSVGSIERMKNVAARCLATARQGHQVAVVVSAMSGETNRLLELTRQLHEDPNDREVDVIVSTGVAIAAALNADVCEIYTDVDGVYTTDPNLVPTARKIERISYEEMLELASLGAKVLQIRSVELGMKYGVPIHVRSSFSDATGTWVVPEEASMEKVIVSGVTASRDESKITCEDLPDQPGIAARMFAPLADAGVSIDMIVQNQAYDGTTDLTFTLPKIDRKRAIELLKDKVPDIVGANGERI